MKKFLSILLAIPALAFGQVNVQKAQGTNAVSNGPVAFGSGNTLSAGPGATVNFTGATLVGFGGSSSAWSGLTGIPSPTFTINGDIAVVMTLLASGSATASATLPSVNANAGTFAGITANAKGLITAATALTIGTTAPLTGGGTLGNLTLAITQAGTASNGYLSSTDWNTFNGKQAAGNYLTALTGDGTATGPGSAAFTLATVNVNTGTFAGITLNGKGQATAASAISLTTTAPITGGGTLGSLTIAMPVATSTNNGYLSAADWSTFNGKAPAGSYITSLTGDVIASGPGAAAATVQDIGGKAIILGGTFGTSGANSLVLTTTANTNVTLPTSGTLATTSQIPSLPLTGANGGTGVANTGHTITVGGNLTTSGSFNTTLTETANTALTLPTSGTLLTTTGNGSGLTNLTAANVTAGALANGMTATTQANGDNSTKIATTAYVAANASGITGPGTTTVNALAPWGNTTGTGLINSAVTLTTTTNNTVLAQGVGNLVVHSLGNLSLSPTGTSGNVSLSSGSGSGSITLTSGSSGSVSLLFGTGGIFIDPLATGDVVLGQGPKTTADTNSFIYVPSVPGTPTGTPSGQLGYQPIEIDTTNKKLAFYDSTAWQEVGSGGGGGGVTTLTSNNGNIVLSGNSGAVTMQLNSSLTNVNNFTSSVSTNLAFTTASVNQAITFTGNDGTGAYPIQFKNTATGPGMGIATMLGPNLTDGSGDAAYFLFGVANAHNECSVLAFVYNSAGTSSANATMIATGGDNGILTYGTGNVAVNAASSKADTGNGVLQLPQTTASTSGIDFGDTQLYRSAAGMLTDTGGLVVGSAGLTATSGNPLLLNGPDTGAQISVGNGSGSISLLTQSGGSINLTATDNILLLQAGVGVQGNGYLSQGDGAEGGGGVGYTSGAGGTVTQSTNRATTVSIDTYTGTITGNATSLAGATSVTFTVNDSKVGIADVPALAIQSGAAVTTLFHVTAVANGSFNITETNVAVTPDATTPVINFSVGKGSSN